MMTLVKSKSTHFLLVRRESTHLDPLSGQAMYMSALVIDEPTPML